MSTPVLHDSLSSAICSEHEGIIVSPTEWDAAAVWPLLTARIRHCVENAGFDVSDLAPTRILQMVLNPSQQARELQGALSSASGIPGSSGVEIPPPRLLHSGALVA